MLGPQRRARIVELVQQHGMLRIADIVEQFGVSRKTALRDLDELAGQGVVDKVHGGAIAVTASVQAQSTSSDAPPVHVGLLLPTDRHYNRTILRSVEAVVGAVNGKLTFATTGWNRYDLPPDGLDTVLGAGVDGILLRPSPPDVETARRAWLEELTTPTVLIEDEPAYFEASNAWSVAIDDERGIAAATQHLFDLGHRRIGLILTKHAHAARISRAWRASLGYLGLDDAMPVIHGAHFSGWPLPKPAELDRLLEEIHSVGATAVICHNDVPARALVQHANELGYSVPDKLSIVAYEDKIASQGPVPLTAVALPQSDTGRIAAQALLDLIHDPAQPPRRLRMEPELVQRRSTGPPS